MNDMMKKGLRLAALAAYVAAVFLIVKDHYWIGIILFGAGTVMLSASKGKLKAAVTDQGENKPTE
jgi:hypothetical protein